MVPFLPRNLKLHSPLHQRGEEKLWQWLYDDDDDDDYDNDDEDDYKMIIMCFLHLKGPQTGLAQGEEKYFLQDHIWNLYNGFV